MKETIHIHKKYPKFLHCSCCMIRNCVRIETNSVFEGVLDMVCLGTAVYFTRDEK